MLNDIMNTWSHPSHLSWLKMIDFNAKTQGLSLHSEFYCDHHVLMWRNVGFYVFVPMKMQKIVQCW